MKPTIPRGLEYSVAFQMGASAHDRGKPRSVNPYTAPPSVDVVGRYLRRWTAWRDGWDFAHAETWSYCAVYRLAVAMSTP